MKKILLFVLAITGVITANASYLYWTVDGGNSTVDSSNYNAARAYIIDSNNEVVSGSQYLTDLETSKDVVDTRNTARFDLTVNGTDYGLNKSGYSYVIELGNYASETFNTTYTTTVSYDSANTLGLLNTGDLTINQAMRYWQSEAAYAVPEPTGAMLMLVGMALLGLKRRKA